MFYLAHRKQKIGDETPISVFDIVRGDYAALLHSGKGGRYSFIGYRPFLLLESRNGVHQVSELHYEHDDVSRDIQIVEGDAVAFLEALVQQLQPKSSTGSRERVGDDLPPFVGGAMGFFSYDYGAKLAGVTSTARDDLEVPDIYFCFYDRVIAFDHERNDMYVFGLGESAVQAQKIAEEIQDDLVRAKKRAAGVSSSGRAGGRVKLHGGLSRPEFAGKISEIKELLASGETYQVNFSHRFSCDIDVAPWDIYQRLYAINPAPFACYFEVPDGQVVSCSPERLVRVHGDHIETRPIKGTRPRGSNDVADEQFEQDLLDSAKDNAELTMIVDLMRNDLARVCDAGSVKVKAHRTVERYSHVMHTVSVIEGKRKKSASLADIVRAVFPGGSVTGCPKIRTMEIIDRLEGVVRDVYCGSAGYLSVSGDMDLNILIRTMLCRDGEATFHAGGGIVVDSDAELEYEETLHKAQALVESVA